MKDNHVSEHIKTARKKKQAEKAKQAGPIALTRKMARNIAKANMQKKGFRRINRMFAKEWRKYVNA